MTTDGSHATVKPWLHLQFSARAGNLTSSKLFCDRSRRWYCSAILLQNLPLVTRRTSWLRSPCNFTKKCCIASVSKNVRRAAASLQIRELKQTDAAAAILQISIHKDSRPSEFSRPLISITLNLNGDFPVDRRRGWINP